MADLPPDHVFVYPDPSLLGIKFTPPQSSPRLSPLSQEVRFPGPNAHAAPVVAAPAPPFPLDPVLLAQPGQATALAPTPTPTPAPAPAPAPVPMPTPAPAPIVAAPVPPPPPGPVPAPPLSAAGLQPFPALTPGLQAPIELTDAAQIQEWNSKLRESYDNSPMGLRNGRRDTNKRFLPSRQSRARESLKDLWEGAGGAPRTRR